MLNRPLFDIAPLANEWVLGIASAPIFSNDQCRLLTERLATGDALSDDTSELLRAVCVAVEHANHQYFRFSVDGIIAPGEPSLVKLTPGAGLKQLDIGLSSQVSIRKISALVVLSVKGELEITVASTGRTTSLAPGLIVMAPSYVDLVVGGTEGASAWVAALHAVGPAFQ